MHGGIVKKFLILFLSCLPVQIFAGVGDHDNRYYVTDEMWATEPYKKFVLIEIGQDLDGNFLPWAECTAQYVSQNLILSAGHCVDNDSLYKVRNYKGDEFYVTLWSTYYSGEKIEAINDWAIWVVADPKYYSDVYFDLSVPTKTIDVINAGWGWVRILSDKELDRIREILRNVRGDVASYVDRVLQEEYKECWRKKRTDRRMINRNNEGFLTESSIDCPQEAGIIDNKNRLKASNCQVLYNRADYNKYSFPEILPTTCVEWQGNSGGGYVSQNGNYLYGIVSFGKEDFSGGTTYATSALQFAGKLESSNISTATVQETTIKKGIYDNEYDISLLINKHIQALSQETKKLDVQIASELPNVQEMTNYQLLGYLDKIVEHQVKSEQLEKLEKAYRDVRENEQSTANKLLTAATVAATGLGGMEWARGAAEQWADEEAETEMAGYLAGMRCEYGGGQTLNLGAEMTLPAGDLTDYYTEYKQLADKLKETKVALNLRPGIESEVLYDQAQSGLYQYQTAEVQSGGNPSLSRALMNPDGEDAAAWNAQKAGSAEKAESGKGWGIGGAVGGALGNIGINTDLIENLSGKNGN